MVLLVIFFVRSLYLTLARRYYAEKGEREASPQKKDDDEETAPATLAKMPQDPMSKLRTPCIKTINTSISRTQLEDVSPLSCNANCSYSKMSKDSAIYPSLIPIHRRNSLGWVGLSSAIPQIQMTSSNSSTNRKSTMRYSAISQSIAQFIPIQRNNPEKLCQITIPRGNVS